MKGFDETENGSASIWIYLHDWTFSVEVKLKQFQKSILDYWRWSQGVEDGEEVKMLVRYSMQSYGASLVFLRTPGEVISEEYTSD